MEDGFKDPEQADDVYDISTSSSNDGSNSSSSPSHPEESKLVFEGSKPLVLELHDMTRSKQPTAVTGVAKKKLRKKKKKADQKIKRASSSSQSDVSLQPTTDAKEEFYDAHESYHGIPPHQQTPALEQIAAPEQRISPVSVLVTPAASIVPPVTGVVTQEGKAKGPDLLTPDLKVPGTVPETASESLAAAKTAITKPTNP